LKEAQEADALKRSRDRIVREEIAQRQSQEQQARKELDEFLLQLDVKEPGRGRRAA
jgi:hypothetical protein